jgi:peptide/nickel transport system permease protein
MRAARIRLVPALRTPVGAISAVTVLALVLLAILAPVIWGARADAVNVPQLLQGSTAHHLLGTDNLGRDILARILVATRLSLTLAVLAIAVGAALGVPLGALPTVLGPRAARVTATFIEFSLAFPGLLLAIFLSVVIGVGATSAVLAIGVSSAPGFARLTQTLAASAAGSDYVAAARILGVSRGRILFRHILPNIAEPIILNVTIAIGYALLAMSGLSFIGLGVQPPLYDWGRLLNDALDRIYVTPSAALGAACAIVIAGLAFNGLGEAFAAAAGSRIRLTGRPAARPAAAPASDAGTPQRPSAGPVLAVDGLSVVFPRRPGALTPVREVSFELRPGELVGVVGESGSGKSLTALAIAQLLPYPGIAHADHVLIDGHDPQRMSTKTRKRLLGRALAMVFQDPATSMNPAVRVGRQLAEMSEVHEQLPRAAAQAKAVERLRSVRIASPEQRIRQFPHELSGGMRQRAMIAMGLMVSPRVIIADEPTSALDVTVQRQILDLLRQVRDDTGVATMLISHDIAVVSELCQRVLVMYAGRIVEDIEITALRGTPAHPYTRALLATIPDMTTPRELPLATIAGQPPDPGDEIQGCAFAARCPLAETRCRCERPELSAVDGSAWRVACWRPQLQDSAVAVQSVRAEHG